MDDFNITYIGYDLEINENPLYNYNDNMANINMDFYKHETIINNTAIEENKEIKNNILCPVEFEENIQQINIKKCSNKYKLNITHMKAKLRNALEILKITKYFTNNILSTTSKGNLTSKEVPVFKKIIYDIVSYTTTPVQRKVFGAMIQILNFLSEELNIPTLKKYIKVDNIQNALTHCHEKCKKIQSNINNDEKNKESRTLTMEELNDQLQYKDCFLEHFKVVVKYLSFKTA
uniref:Uncharacterized protein n=1 Tax=Strongyloides stercoralis TaxID=6248 RepID=A0AAF5DHI0_STRER